MTHVSILENITPSDKNLCSQQTIKHIKTFVFLKFSTVLFVVHKTRIKNI